MMHACVLVPPPKSCRMGRPKLEKERLPKPNLPQLYRFCFLMMGDAAKAEEVFQAVMHEAALRAAAGELPADPLWMYREARGHCLEHIEAAELQPEEVEMEEHDLNPAAPAQIARL